MALEEDLNALTRLEQAPRLAERIDAAGCPIVVVLNKWELLDAEQRADLRWQVSDKLRFVGDDEESGDDEAPATARR